MPDQPTGLTPWGRSGLVILCLLLAASVAMRVYIYRQQSEGSPLVREAISATADLGNGVLLPRSVVQHRTVPVGSCPTPVSIDFVLVSPYGPDPSLVGAPRPDDRVFYVYRGWNLGSSFATATLNAIYFARRLFARLSLQQVPAFDEFAVKIIVPAGCDVPLDEVMTTLR